MSSSQTPSQPLPSPPFVTIEGVRNCRDIGGYSIASKPTSSVRRGLIYRSANPGRITTTGESQLVNDLHIKTIYDLRSEPEIARHALQAPTYNIAGTTRIYNPVYRDEDYSPETHAKRYQDDAAETSTDGSGGGGSSGFVKAYSAILRTGGDAFAVMLKHIRDRPSDPFMLHCAIGKDRTGVFSMLVLRLAGVEDEIIAKEFALTENGLGEWKQEILAKLMKDPLAKGSKEKELERMLSAKAEDMRAVLGWLDGEYGGAEGYVVSRCGLSEEDVRRIKANLVVDVPPVCDI